MIRNVIREGRAKGVSDSDVLMYAKISAHSGIDIVFDKEATKVKNNAGEDTYRSAFYEWQNNRITVNPESKSGAEGILIHELDHAVRNYFGKDGQRMTKVFDRALSETDESTRKKILEKSEEVAKPGQLENVFKDEVNSYFAERMLTNKQTLERIIEAEPGLKDRILSFFKGASADYADAPKLSGSAKWYYKKFKKMFDEFSARNQQNNASENTLLGTNFAENSQKTSLTNINQGNMHVSDRQYSLRIKHTDGMIEELADAKNLTRNQAIEYLEQAKKGKLFRDTYIPVRSDTPQVIIDTLEQVNEKINNQSLVMQVRKARKAMSAENRGARGGKYGNNVRPHSLTPEKIVDIVSKLDEPSLMIYQTNRRGQDGEALPNNVSVFVEYTDGGKESVAIIEFESSINPEFIGKEFGDTSYHTVVTIFEPDTERYGEPFDYAEELLQNPNNIELQIKRRPSNESAIGKKHPNTFKELPSVISTPQKTEIDNTFGEKSLENSSDKQFALDIDSEGEVNEDGSISGAVVMSWLKDKHSDGKAFDAESVAARGLPYKSGRSTLTVGELRKVLANSRNDKVFSKGDALNVVNRMSGAWGLTQKARDEIADVVWQFLNEAQNLDGRREIAEGIAEYITAKVLVDSKTENPDAPVATERLALGVSRIELA